jgi:hypothetical protein
MNKYSDDILAASADPSRLESLYQAAVQRGEQTAFNAALLACYQEAPDNLLFAAWYYRLLGAPAERQPAPARTGLWLLAVPLALLSGLLIGLIASANDIFLQHIPYVVLLWAPIAASVAILFLALAAKSYYRQAILAIGLLVIAVIYVLLISPTQTVLYGKHYLDQMAIHLPLLAWIALGFTLLGLRALVKDRFSFLIKSIEVAITAGLYLIAGVAFGVITMGMLQALSIELPEKWMLFLAGGGFGLIPILAIASIYDPRLRPSEQDFSQGLSKFIAFMMRLLLPLTLLVLAVYVVLLIPFNFLGPFLNRDALIVFNIMLFAVVGLLLGAMPIFSNDLTPRLKTWLRYGILAVAGLAILVSLYAFAAILYRTFNDTLTLNRLVIIGWNLINTTILGFLFYQVWRKGQAGWVEAAQVVYSRAIPAYVVWTLCVIFIIPLIFR